MAVLAKILLRKDTATNWSNNNPVLDAGEVGVITDKHTIKVGDGETAFNDLPELALDTEVVHLAGDEIIDGVKTFAQQVVFQNGIQLANLSQDDTLVLGLVLDPSDNTVKIKDLSTLGGGSGTGLSITPVTRYDGELVEGVFNEIQLPSDVTINDIKGTLEIAPAGNDSTDSTTSISIEYTTDGGTTWTQIAQLDFTEGDTTTNGILIKDVVPSETNFTENTRIRFNVTQTAANFAGANLKIYFK